MVNEWREWTQVPFQFGGQIPILLPRNVNMSEIEVQFIPGVTDGAGFIANVAFNGFQLRFRGRMAFDRDNVIVREMMEAFCAVPGIADFWTVKPEGGLRGSESNYLQIACEANPVLVGGIGATIAGTNGIIAIRYKPASSTGKRMVDSRFFLNYGANVGFQDFAIPMLNARLLYIVLRSAGDAVAGVLADRLTDIIEVINVSRNTSIKRGTIAQLIAESQNNFKYAHNVGLIIIPLDMNIGIKEQIVLRTWCDPANVPVAQVYDGLAIAQVL